MNTWPNVAKSLDLPSLLWIALSGLDNAHVDRGAGKHGVPSLPQWANLLRCLRTEESQYDELPTLLRISKRAVRSNVATAIREGWAEQVIPSRTLRLTPCGADVASKWDCLREAAENQWQESVGVKDASNARASLERIVALLPLEHSHYPAGYGAADARITGGSGRDWKPVPRGKDDTVSALPLSASISQALVAFATAYEEKSEVALSLSATVIKRVPPAGQPTRGLGTSAALSAMQRHGFLRAHAGEHGPVLRLTTKGLEIKRAHDAWVRAVEQAWRQSIGEDIMANLRGSLDTIAERSRVGHRKSRHSSN